MFFIQITALNRQVNEYVERDSTVAVSPFMNP